MTEIEQLKQELEAVRQQKRDKKAEIEKLHEAERLRREIYDATYGSPVKELTVHVHHDKTPVKPKISPLIITNKSPLHKPHKPQKPQRMC